MAPTRDNHYVPQWYQEGFFIQGRTSLSYLDMSPAQHKLPDGRIVLGKALFDSPTARMFFQTDLYSTFFGTSINDEIERRLFGDIDTRGSKAVRAFIGSDVTEWHKYFEAFFEYIDIQKTRTPKGLDWLRAQYPALTQNELMHEMQGIRMMHCTIWTEGVREIVSAESSEVKFIVSDHPVTIYNYAAPPNGAHCTYPHDPSITLKASQTIFPLSQNFCLILTNLEYARDPATPALDKRTFARHFRNSMVRTDAFVRTRQLTGAEVIRINHILKARARRFIAAGRKEWLYPERVVDQAWTDLRHTLMPSADGLFHFGGEMFAKFDDGRVHYQDEFGRTEKQRDFLKKPARLTEPRPREQCNCGSGLAYGDCCSSKPPALRPSWVERSIRERNLMFLNAIANVLGLDGQKDWVTVRREITDEKIAKVYSLFAGLWPLETDLLALLPKPDGRPRAVYTGLIHPDKITDVALGASLYFGQMLIQHPFIHPRTMKPEFSPIENPRAYRNEFLKATVLFLTVLPLIESGMINLVPDPCHFDSHLRKQMFAMAKDRSRLIAINPRDVDDSKALIREDLQRSLMALPAEALRSLIRKSSPELSPKELDNALRDVEALKARDPLAVLQDNAIGEGKSGQLSMMALAPNFEMALYLAQATGACIVTDSRHRWNEIQRTLFKPTGRLNAELPELANAIGRAPFLFPRQASDVQTLFGDPAFVDYRALTRDSFKYLSKLRGGERKPNVEQNLAARFARSHGSAQAIVRRQAADTTAASVSCVFPTGGIQDRTVNRLLLMSNSEHHLPAVPMAFYIRPEGSGEV